MIHFFHYWRAAILVVAVAPLAFYATATAAAWRFFRKERAQPLPVHTPAVSVLKPIHGVDFASYENYASFCRQDYPEYEILFGVNDASDPAIEVIERVIADHPGNSIRLFVGANPIDANRKVNMLARLTREARYEVLSLTDGDVRVGPQYLREVAAPFADKNTGAVTCFYRGIVDNNLGAQLEAIGASSDLFAGVLVANCMEGITFALGASITTTKEWVARIGGFEAIAGMLADDYELGNRIAKSGGRVRLSREAVWTMYPAQTARGFWEHQVRWGRTVRLCRPISYIGLLFTHGLPWAVLAAVVAPAKWISAAYLGAYFVLRMSAAWTVGVWGVEDEVLREKLWLVPVRDAIQFVIWLASFASNRVVWGGVEYGIKRGKMIPLSAADGEASDEAQNHH
ncbi:MAG: bacteriohopanetetrol glucosamine biosynthesis glycosyltransferase HpnI [Candidatus Acidiferrum sp.]